MKFPSPNKLRAGNRRSRQLSAPAEIDTLESRLLLTTTPNLLTPSGTVTAATPEFTWEAVDNAESYTLWITSLETYEAVLVQDGIVGTSYTPAEGALAAGQIRIWVRANLTGGGTSPWSASSEANIQSAPTVTGPVGSGTRNLVADNTPEITWNAPQKAARFQIWVTDLTAKATAEANAGTDPVDPAVYATVYNVANLTPELDINGDPVLDGFGNPILNEVRSVVLTEDVTGTTSDAAEKEFAVGRYRIWIRSFDQSGNASRWSDGYTFDVGAKPENLTPDAPTFHTSPNLMWDTVERATHYEVFLSQHGGATPFYRYTVAASETSARQSAQIIRSVAGTPIVDNGNDVVENTEIPQLDSLGNPVTVDLPAGSYTFWVRAINMGTGVPTVYGAWSSGQQFSTLTAPAITGPVADSGYVTSAMPTVEWTKIHGAARYEILVHKFNSRPPYLEATSNTLSYTFDETLPAGDYTIWVRAIDTRGNYSPWSDSLAITATGGRPVLTSPVAGELTLFPTFTWVGVSEAASYEVWVSHIGVDFTFVNVSGITDTTFLPNDPADPGAVPLDNGDYRVWVRAILADGTFGPWSVPVDFQGGVAATETPDHRVGQALAMLETTSHSIEPEMKVEAPATPADDLPNRYGQEDVVEDDGPHATTAVDGEATTVVSAANNKALAADSLVVDALNQIAQDCVSTEWWQNTERTA